MLQIRPSWVVHFSPEQVVHIAPDLLVHFSPESLVHFTADYSMGDVVLKVLGGKPRVAEYEFVWYRCTLALGIKEFESSQQ